ncbi:MAG: glycosyltransferase family 8 protein [Acetobacter sp.]|nr:glycosyltransferase family 8 protein [Acetobacter sp.]
MQKKYIGIIGTILVVVSLFCHTHQPVVNIAYMADTKYLPYVMTSLHSAIVNKKEKTHYKIHIIAKDFTPQDIEKIKQMTGKNIEINIYSAQKLNLDFSHLGRFSSFQVALQKLFIAQYLQNVNKVLYLDADTLVQTDLADVYQTNLKEKYAAAVKDGLMYQYPEHITELNLKNKDFYFNSGVMLLNLDKIRQDNIMQKAIIYFNTHSEIFGDQDVLNVVFKDKVQSLSYRYNCNSVFFEEKDAAFLSSFWQENVPENPEQVYKTAAILHFAGHKPWTEWFKHPYLKSLWQKYAKETQAKYSIDF